MTKKLSYQRVKLRVTKDTRTLIDHFCSNKTDLITLVGVSKITISDHYLIYGVCKFPNLKPKEIAT